MEEIAAGAPIGAGLTYLLWKVVGPSADEVGKALGEVTAYRLKNLRSVADKARTKLGAEEPDTEGVHPRVAHRVLDDGSWVDDDLMQEYLGGLLASSRRKGLRDDQAAYFTNLVTGLTSHQVLLHYLLYRALLGAGTDAGRNLNNVPGRSQCNVFLPLTTVAEACGVSEMDAYDLASRAVAGLHREGLVGRQYGVATKPELLRFSGAPSGGVQIAPTDIGATLFLWANGVPGLDPTLLLHNDLRLPALEHPLPNPAGALIGPGEAD